MRKDFDGWNLEKQAIDAKKIVRFCHPREIWWCSLGVNVGFEQDGTGKNYDRPFVVLKSFNRETFWGAALTGSRREDRYHFPLGKIVDREASVILSQIRLVDVRRLSNKISILSEPVFQKLKSALHRALFE